METLTRISEDTLKIAATPLSTTLLLAGVRPFDEKSVEAYKQEMVEANPPSFWGRYVGITRGVLSCFALLAMLCLVFGAVIGIGSAIASLFITGMGGIILLCTVTAIGGFVALSAASFMVEIKVHGPAVWKLYTLREYDLRGNDIPDEAIRMVELISRERPQTQFLVESLEQNDIEIDPFLAALDPETREYYYIWQWDEPLFQLRAA